VEHWYKLPVEEELGGRIRVILTNNKEKFVRNDFFCFIKKQESKRKQQILKEEADWL
jgi:hypothetical protein